MNLSSNATVDSLIQWLAHSQQPLPPPPAPLPLLTAPRSVNIEALLAGTPFTPEPRQSTVEHFQALSLLQFLQQRSGGAPVQNNDRQVASMLNSLNSFRVQDHPAPIHRVGPRSIKKGFNQRQEFFLLVKFLLKVLKDNDDMDRLVRAKAIIAECTLRNRNGDSAFLDLQASVQSRLRRTVGEVYWSQAKDLIDRVRRSMGVVQGVVAAV